MESNQITQIKSWFEKAVPEPTDKSRAVQIGVHFEEVGEMLTAINERNMDENEIDDLSWWYKNRSTGASLNNVDRLELLDSLCDQIVTAVGVAYMFGLDIEKGLAEVIRSNNSKFVDGKPVFDANGKIAKPSTYSKPELKDFV